MLETRENGYYVFIPVNFYLFIFRFTSSSRSFFFVLLIIFVFFDLAFLCRLQFVRNGSKHRDNKLVWVKKMTSHCTLECNFARN